ncbi:MAG: sugar phosphate isomerase/epimerase [Pirellulales bacterium]|nr:sugar phosphate isomerase/epimerase [Pirellulales bacterium]
MNSNMDRRVFLKATGTIAVAGIAGLGPRVLAAEAGPGAPNAEKIGWKLGCQAYTFNRFTFYEAVDKNRSLGLRWIEAYPGQKLSAEQADVEFGPKMSPEIRKTVKAKLADSDVTLINFGVVGLSSNEAESRTIFEFAKDMGIQTIVSEPPLDAFDLIEKLCEQYQINVALHNHPEPSRYWNPDTVLTATKGRGNRIGACADTGHWMRSGINPLDAVRKLEKRIISFHLKDLNKYGHKDAHDVPWGTGQAGLKAVLAEVCRQGFQGVFSIEYEHNWLNSLPEITESVAFFDKTAAELKAKS